MGLEEIIKCWDGAVCYTNMLGVNMCGVGCHSYMGGHMRGIEGDSNMLRGHGVACHSNVLEVHTNMLSGTMGCVECYSGILGGHLGYV